MEHADAFLEAWSIYDPEATGRLHVKHLADVIRLLPPPLGLDPANYRNRMILSSHIAKYVYQMDLHTHRVRGGPPEVYFKELLACLVKDAYRDETETAEEGEEEEKEAQAPPLRRRDSGSNVHKASKEWGSVLPTTDSKLGKQLHALLSDLNIYREGEEREQERRPLKRTCSLNTCIERALLPTTISRLLLFTSYRFLT